jgi:hypothetical protein
LCNFVIWWYLEEREKTNKTAGMSIRTEVIQQTNNHVENTDDVWNKNTNGNVVNDASYMGIDFISHEGNQMMIAGSMNPINIMSEGDGVHNIAEQGLAIRVVVPDCDMVAHVLETDDIGSSRLVRVDYVHQTNVVMQILLRRIATEDDKLTSVGINVNVIDDTVMYGNNVVYNENGMDSIRMSLSDLDGKETVITGRRVPRQRLHKTPNKGRNDILIGGLIVAALLAFGFAVYQIKKEKK